MKKVFLIPVIIMLAAASAYGQRLSFDSRFTAGAHVPAPRLISPVTSSVDLTGKNTLKFEWSPYEGNRMIRKGYDFRLYEGTQMLESTLILKRMIDPGTWSVELKAGLFENSLTYTWSLRQVYDTGDKSRRSTHTFTVIK